MVEGELACRRAGSRRGEGLARDCERGAQQSVRKKPEAISRQSYPACEGGEDELPASKLGLASSGSIAQL